MTYQVGNKISGVASLREGKTTPPKLFSDGDLIDVMKNIVNYVKIESDEARQMLSGSGIGTARTRGGIIRGLFDKMLIEQKSTTGGRKSKIIIPTTKGLELYSILLQYVPQLTNPMMTAQWEAALGMIEAGTVTYEQFLDKQRKFQVVLINAMKSNITATPRQPKEVVDPIEGHGELCDKCKKGKMTTRATKADKNKKFLACDNVKQENGKWVGCDNVKWANK